MRTVNISDLKAQLSAHIQLVRDGEEVLVCDRNRPVARIIPCRLEDQPEGERKLVARGPYRFTRNPMYLGLVILSAGIAVWVGTWPFLLAPIAVFATVNWVHIPFEEAKMSRQFGEEFDSYVRKVRRWV